MEFNQNIQSEKMSVNLKKITILLSAIFLIVFYTWISSPMIIAVDGSGEVTVPATNAFVTFAVSANSQDATNAIASVKAKTDIFRNFLISLGISEEDITESQVSVVPASALVQGGTGFQATITMGVKTIHVSSVSDLVASLYATGSDYVSQPVVSVEDVSQLEQQAFDVALKNAKSKAGKIALKNLKLFRKIVAVEQASSGTTSTSTSKADVVTQNTDEIAAVNGVFKIVKAVSVTYKMW